MSGLIITENIATATELLFASALYLSPPLVFSSPVAYSRIHTIATSAHEIAGILAVT